MEAKKTKEISPDELWKAVVEDMFEEFVEYFMPELYKEIDFTKKYDFLEQELQRLVTQMKRVWFW